MVARPIVVHNTFQKGLDNMPIEIGHLSELVVPGQNITFSSKRRLI